MRHASGGQACVKTRPAQRSASSTRSDRPLSAPPRASRASLPGRAGSETGCEATPGARQPASIVCAVSPNVVPRLALRGWPCHHLACARHSPSPLCLGEWPLRRRPRCTHPHAAAAAKQPAASILHPACPCRRPSAALNALPTAPPFRATEPTPAAETQRASSPAPSHGHESRVTAPPPSRRSPDRVPLH